MKWNVVKKYSKNTKNSDTTKNGVIMLKFEQCDLNIEWCTQKMQMEWKTL